jgi:putative tryptophan/tyrosine transport system substrate-binding protein
MRRIGLVLAPMLLTLGLALAPLPAQGQQARVPSVGYLGNSSASLETDLLEAFRRGLWELGYTEGQNIIIEYRWAEGRYDRFPALVSDLVRIKVDAIVTAGTPGALAAKQATKTIPIVMTVAGDAVGTGLVASLARPGGNVTGSTTIVQELEGKRLELLKEVVPRLSRLAILATSTNPVIPIIFETDATRGFGAPLETGTYREGQRYPRTGAGLCDDFERAP